MSSWRTTEIGRRRLGQFLRAARHRRNVERGQLFDAEPFEILGGPRRLRRGLSLAQMAGCAEHDSIAIALTQDHFNLSASNATLSA